MTAAYEEHKLTAEELAKFHQIFGKHYRQKTKNIPELKWVFDNYPNLNLRMVLNGEIKTPKIHHKAVMAIWRSRIASGGRTIRQEDDGC